MYTSEIIINIKYILLNFTLYPAYSSVGIANLVLRHTIPQAPLNFQDIVCQVADYNAALCLATKAKNDWELNP